MRCIASALFVAAIAAVAVPDADAQGTREALSFPRDHRGAQISIPGTLLLPAGSGKVPAMVVHHGSGGVSEQREFRYAKELVAMGVAALVIDSFKPRGVTSTVLDQGSVTELEMTTDAFGALKVLAAHARIDPAKIGIMGFSKGGTIAWRTARANAVKAALPGSMQFALHVPFYPACNNHFFNRTTTGAPIVMLLGSADTYAGVAPCLEYADKLKAASAKVEVKIYQGARHGFDGDADYAIASGENWSKCVFEEQSDGTWKERKSGLTIFDAKGKRDEATYRQALSGCRTSGVSGGPNAAAKAAALTDLKQAVTQHLLGR